MSGASRTDDQRELAVLSVITARKLAFLSYLKEVARRRGLEKHHPDNASKGLDETLSEIVAEMAWTIFVTEDERRAKKLTLGVSLDQLDKERLWQGVEKLLTLRGYG